jgi:hypothetical protein
MKDCLETSPFIPRARKGESPAGVLLRFTGAHFEQPTYALSHAGLKTRELPPLIMKLFRGDTNLLSKIAILDEWEPNALIAQKASSRFHKDWVNPKVASVCPQCAEDRLLPAYHDVVDVDACAKHGLTLLTHCPHCEQQISWSRPSLTHCKCYSPLDRRIPAKKADVEFAGRIQAFTASENATQLEYLLTLTRVLQNRYGLGSEAKRIALDFADGDMATLGKALARYAKGHPALLGRAIIAPLAEILSRQGIDDLIILKEMAKRLPRAKSACLPGNFALNRQDLIYVLRCTSKCINAILSSHIINAPQPLDQKTVSLDNLKWFFAHLGNNNIDAEAEQASSLRELTGKTGKPIAEWVEDILNGVYKPTQPLADDGLPNLRINCAATLNDDVPADCLTQHQAEQYTGLYGVALTAAREANLVPSTSQPNRCNRYLYKQVDLDCFLRTYVSSGQLAKRFKTQAKSLKKQLEYLGIEPVSGGDIDSTSIYYFRRTETDSITLAALAKAKESYAGAGRKSRSAPRLNTDKWANSKETAQFLGLASPQSLDYLTQVTPLVQGEPEHKPAGRTRYFRRRSLEAAQRFINSLVSIEALSGSTGLSQPKLTRRINQLLKNAIITINHTHYLSEADAERITDHCSELWCADTVAAYLDCNRADVNNWRKLRHLTSIGQEVTGYLGTPHLYRRQDLVGFIKPADRKNDAS